tara:strand:- start:1003 stop:1659 length:657 start_codon:yes stop_codon:yes gene_type:complete
MNDRKVILTIGPQFSGTKLTDSVFKTFFGCKGTPSEAQGTPDPLDKTSNLAIRFSYPTKWLPYFDNVCVKRTDFPYSKFENAGWVNIDNLLSKIKLLYDPKDIHIITPIRDFTSVIKSGLKQGSSLSDTKLLHTLSLEFIVNLIKNYSNKQNIHYHWLSYEFLTYDPEKCILALSNEIDLPIVLNEKVFKEKCSKIIPRNSVHVLDKNQKYIPANHVL